MINTENQSAIWKTYPEYLFIEANQFGEVRTKDRIIVEKNGKKRHLKGRVLKQHDNGRGYMKVSVSTNGRVIRLYVHRIAASCFIPNPLNLPEVNHRDNDPTNNSVNNLEWCTRKYNIAYKEKYGTSAAEALGRPVVAVDLKTFKILRFESQHEAARQLGVDQRMVNMVIKGHRKTAGGYWFCNANENAVEKVRAEFGDKVANEVKKLMV